MEDGEENGKCEAMECQCPLQEGSGRLASASLVRSISRGVKKNIFFSFNTVIISILTLFKMFNELLSTRNPAIITDAAGASIGNKRPITLVLIITPHLHIIKFT